MSRRAGQIVSKRDIQLVLTCNFIFVITVVIPLSQSHISWRYVVRDSTSLQNLLFPWSDLFSELPSLYLLSKKKFYVREPSDLIAQTSYKQHELYQAAITVLL